MFKPFNKIKIALHIPISPNIKFYSKILWIRKSLDYLGAPYSNSKIHITISNENDISIENIIQSFPEFLKNRNRYFFYLTEKNEFLKFSYGETAGLRYLNIDKSDITILCDSDILFINRIDQLVKQALKHNCIYGVLAHYSPFSRDQDKSASRWNELSVKYTNNKIELPFYHSLDPSIKCPAYFNNGFIIGNRRMWSRIKNLAYQNYKEIFYDLPINGKTPILSERFFTMQVSLTIVMLMLKIRAYPVNEIYNCANQNEMIPLLKNNIKDIKIIHYLRNNYFDRDEIFQTQEKLDSFLKLTNIDEISGEMQEHVLKIINSQGYF